MENYFFLNEENKDFYKINRNIIMKKKFFLMIFILFFISLTSYKTYSAQKII